ncbi:MULTISPECIES: hypothetical protein [Pseudomonas]|uniref:Uncharacterized protein n=1 Tax=Pseudomonas entomophila TaxID=312306 RepID=A0A3Q8TZE8_9PSED|nr:MULTISPECIES: hypothetical protein [Pseudomonas]AZL67882.1 hypothetical protein EJA05_09075 [Pseudomonas oryziphila]MDZ4017439.1 hypothetical protein [Pseudomonas sichuanensis]UVL90997.1 hypothetical protein LOY51_09000 [Pseudomonas sichuanensis]
MTVWLVVSILALILSPLAWLRPSRKQSRQMNLRLEGRRMGLAMQLAPQEWPHWLEKQPPSPCPQYHRARRKGHDDSWCYWQVSTGVWWNRYREPCEDSRLLEAFAGLPESVYKIEADTQMVALFWGERGEDSVLQDIAKVLETLA